MLWKLRHLVHLVIMKLVNELLTEVSEYIVVLVGVHHGLTDSLEELASVSRDGPERVVDQSEEPNVIGFVGVDHSLAKVGAVQAMHKVRRDTGLLLASVDLVLWAVIVHHSGLQAHFAHEDQVNTDLIVDLVLLPHRETVRGHPVDRHGGLEDVLGLLAFDLLGQQLGRLLEPFHSLNGCHYGFTYRDPNEVGHVAAGLLYLWEVGRSSVYSRLNDVIPNLITEAELLRPVGQSHYRTLSDATVNAVGNPLQGKSLGAKDSAFSNLACLLVHKDFCRVFSAVLSIVKHCRIASIGHEPVDVLHVS